MWKKVRLVFHAQFCGYFEKEIQVSVNASDEDIKAMFKMVLGVSFDDNCYYEYIE